MAHTPLWPWVWVSWTARDRQALEHGGGHGPVGSSLPAGGGAAALAQLGMTTVPPPVAAVQPCNTTTTHTHQTHHLQPFMLISHQQNITHNREHMNAKCLFSGYMLNLVFL